MEKFQFITHDNHDPYFNLASEEYLLKETKGYYVYLWINAPAVIVGVNQNALEEVNIGYTEKNDIKVVRRLTGGGAVYHDLNNICYTVIAPYNPEQNTYETFSKPVIDYLKSLGLSAVFSGRNDILVDGKKVSGVAQTVFNDRVMHHGTLLFDTDTSVLSKALNPNKLKVQSKGIKSVRSRVTNIKDSLKGEMNIKDFFIGLSKTFLTVSEPYVFSSHDIERINALVESKYSKYEWNFGRSPKGQNKFENKFDFGVFSLNFDIEQGLIKNARITGDFFCVKPIEELEKLLNGCKFTKENLLLAFENIDQIISGANGKEIVEKIFN